MGTPPYSSCRGGWALGSAAFPKVSAALGRKARDSAAKPPLAGQALAARFLPNGRCCGARSHPLLLHWNLLFCLPPAAAALLLPMAPG